MKVTNWRRKLAASLVAGGLLAPCAVEAANLNENLVDNPGFEDVDDGTTCCYNSLAVKINSWTSGTKPGFAYNYGLGFDDGGPLSEGGTYFFGPASGTDGEQDVDYFRVLNPGEVSQDLDVSDGTDPLLTTGGLIASGEAAVVLSGFFTSYNGQNDRHGTMQVDFLNAGGTSLGSTLITSLKTPNPWHQERGAVLVPVGTATLRASLYGNNFNAYIDNVNVQVTEAANELLYLEVNTTNGQVAIKNQTGDPVHLDYYKITSSGGSGSALNASAWNSLQEQNLPGFPAGNGSGNGWEQFGGSDSGVVGESFLTGNSTAANSGSIGLGAAFNVGGAHNLEFRYGVVNESPAAAGDYNNNGAVDAADYTLWRNAFNTAGTLPNQNPAAATPNLIDQEDYAFWKANFGNVGGGFSGPGTPAQGFVRYVTSGAAAGAAVPEPSSVLLVGIGLASLTVGVRRKSSRAVI